MKRLFKVLKAAGVALLVIGFHAAYASYDIDNTITFYNNTKHSLTLYGNIDEDYSGQLNSYLDVTSDANAKQYCSYPTNYSSGNTTNMSYVKCELPGGGSSLTIGVRSWEGSPNPYPLRARFWGLDGVVLYMDAGGIGYPSTIEGNQDSDQLYSDLQGSCHTHWGVRLHAVMYPVDTNAPQQYRPCELPYVNVNGPVNYWEGSTPQGMLQEGPVCYAMTGSSVYDNNNACGSTSMAFVVYVTAQTDANGNELRLGAFRTKPNLPAQQPTS